MNEKERRLENIKQDLASLVERVDVVEREMAMEESENWIEEIQTFIEVNGGSGYITIAVDVSSSMIEHKNLADLLVKETFKFDTRNESLICFSNEVEMYTKYLEKSFLLPLFGGTGDVSRLFEWICKNGLENPLIVFSDGILYPTQGLAISGLKANLKDYNYPVL